MEKIDNEAAISRFTLQLSLKWWLQHVGSQNVVHYWRSFKTYGKKERLGKKMSGGYLQSN